MSQILSSAAVVIGALRVNSLHGGKFFVIFCCLLIIFKNKVGKNAAKFVVCCICDWRFKG